MNELRSKIEEVISAGFNDGTLTRLKGQIHDAFTAAESSFEEDIKADISYNLASFVERMAQESINAILNGDENEMRLRLSCVEGLWTGRGHEHFIIRGSLFEQGAILLRKRIVETFPDLLKNERILDLEDQLRSVSKQFESYRQRTEQANRERSEF